MNVVDMRKPFLRQQKNALRGRGRGHYSHSRIRSSARVITLPELAPSQFVRGVAARSRSRFSHSLLMSAEHSSRISSNFEYNTGLLHCCKTKTYAINPELLVSSQSSFCPIGSLSRQDVEEVYARYGQPTFPTGSVTGQLPSCSPG